MREKALKRRTFFGMMIGATSLAFGHPNRGDNSIWIQDSEVPEFLSICDKLETVKHIVGYGNFNLLSFDEMLHVASRYSKVKEFTKEEIAFIEKMFYENPAKYGFFGERTVDSITTVIDKKEVIKIPHTGHFLFRGHSEESYERVLKDVGDSLFLTSGIRNVPKQMNLYFNKIKSTGGNITAAVHSLAPPAYSYHSVGDFDVGKKGWGYKNFTASFARTEEFWRLRQLSYISMRYTINNKDGVRFEPWHVKIV